MSKPQQRSYLLEWICGLGAVAIFSILIGNRTLKEWSQPYPTEFMDVHHPVQIFLPGEGVYKGMVTDRPGVIDFIITSQNGRYKKISGTFMDLKTMKMWVFQFCPTKVETECLPRTVNPLLTFEDHALIEAVLRQRNKVNTHQIDASAP